MSVFEYFVNLAKRYGPVYTFWMGSRPIVIITHLKIANESFLVKRNEIAGRPYINYCESFIELINSFKQSNCKIVKQIFESHDAFDIAFNDYGPTW